MRSKGIQLTKTPLLAAAVILPVLGFFARRRRRSLMGYGLLFLFTVVWRLFRHGVRRLRPGLDGQWVRAGLRAR